MNDMTTRTDNIPATVDADLRVEEGMRTWNLMRAERDKQQQLIDTLKNYIAKIEAKNEELNSSNTRLQSELEHYRVVAIQAKTHLHIIQGHVNGACENLKGVES